MSTIVLTTPEELRAIISEEVRQAIARELADKL